MTFTKIIRTDKCTHVEIDNGGVLYITGYLTDAAEIKFPAEVKGTRVAGPIGIISNGCIPATFVGKTENSDRTIVSKTSLCQVIENATGQDTYISLYDLFNGHMKKAEKVQKIALSNGMTMVGNRAFCGFSALKKVYLPETLTVIDDLGFGNCVSLENIKIPSSVKRIGECAFSGCTSLKEVTIPGNVSIVDYSAFEECRNLEQITLCDGIEEIGANAFLACRKLTRIDLPDSVKTLYGYGEFSPFAYCDKDLVVTYKGREYRVADDEAQALNLAVNGRLLSGSLLENIPDTPASDFEYVELEDGTLCITDYTGSSSGVKVPETIDGKNVTCTDQGMIGRCGIEVLELPATLKFKPCFIKEYCDYFWESDKAILKAVKLNNKELLMDYLFNGCANLREVSLPDFDTCLGDGMFWDCERLRHLRLPRTLTEMRGTFFEGCTSLKKLVVPDGVKVFEACIFFGMGDKGTPNLEVLKLPDSLEAIESLPFFCMHSLTELVIPDSVRKFGFAEGKLCENCNENLHVTIRGNTYGSIKYYDAEICWIENDPQIWGDIRDKMDCELPENWIKEYEGDDLEVEYL